jgi:hypothetical protein
MDVTRAVWVVCGDHPEQLASYRYVALIPAAQLGARVAHCEPETDPEEFLERNRPAVLILGKAFHPGFVTLAQAAKARAIPVLAAMCDAHFDNPVNIALARIADRIVVPNRAMAEEVRRHFGVAPALIEDPYEGPRGAPRFAPADPLRLLWFGHSANHDTIAAGIAQIGAGARRNIHLSVLTNETGNIPHLLARLPRMKAAIEVVAEEWSLPRQYALLETADAVLLPSQPRPDKRVRGHNRLVQAIHAGRLALAWPLPAYLELADYCFCTRDLGAGLMAALANPAAASARIAAGQAAIDARFAPARIAARWRAEIERVAAATS